MSAAAHGVVMAPVSPNVAKLLHKLTAAIINERPAVPPDAAILLAHEGKPEGRYVEVNGSRQVHVAYGRYRSAIDLTNYRIVERADVLHPNRWYGSETRVDDQGERWTRTLDPHVIDNFGDLVPVGRGA